MQLSKSTLLPIVGMVVLVIFVIFCYVHESIFLDRILVCSFILSIVFINDKIKFHSVRALNLRHEQVNSDRTSEGKIRKLKEDKKIVEQLVLHAHKNGLELEINGTIEIKLVDKHHTVGA